MGVPKTECFAAEIDPELRFILQGKGYGIVCTDWLAYDEPIRYGFIIMNPPFSEGAKHVLKAWEHLQDGGNLIAILNAETIRNPCHKERQLLISHLIGPENWRDVTEEQQASSDDFVTAALRWLEREGRIEWLGQCFKDAERPTDVEVVLIRMEKPKRANPIEFDAKDFQQDAAVNTEEFSQNPLAFPDAIRDLVARYDAARQIILDRETSQQKLNFYLSGFGAPESLRQKVDIDKQLVELKALFWELVFTRTKLQEKATSKFRDKFREFATTQLSMSFTVQNIHDLLAMLIENREQIMRDCCVEVFDKATAYHEKNKVHIEGWKTNKAYRINKRIIMPYAVTCDQWGFWSRNYNISGFLDDLDKVLCWLSGIDFKTLNGKADYTLHDRCGSIRTKRIPYDQPFRSHFFEFRMFKKGTLHVDFLDLELLAQLNRTAAEGKNWIGGGY